MSAIRPSMSAEPRTLVGRKVKRLRVEGKIPANLFGKKIPSIALTVDKREFEKTIGRDGLSTIFDLTIKGEPSPRPVLVTSIQRHPTTDHIVHVDVRQVDLTEKVTATIPIRVVGESIVVRDKGGILVTVHPELQVESLPMDLPDHLDVDIASLAEFGDSVQAKDIHIDRAKVKILAADEETIVTVQEPKKEEEVAPAPAAEAVSAEGEASSAEGESREAGSSTKPAKGEAKPEEKKEEGEKKEEKKKS